AATETKISVRISLSLWRLEEAHRLEQQERRLQREAQRMRANGNLSPAERAKLQDQQNKLTDEIYNQRHDAHTRNGTNAKNPNSLAAQQERLQDRIQRGIKNGSVTPEEAARLEHQEGRINHEAQQMRAADGGQLTKADRQKLERQQNRESQR